MFKMAGMEELSLDPVVLPDLYVTSGKLIFYFLSFCLWTTMIFTEGLVIAYTARRVRCLVCRSVLTSQKEIDSGQCPSSAKFWKCNCTCQLCVSPWQKQNKKKLFSTLKQSNWPRGQNDLLVTWITGLLEKYCAANKLTWMGAIKSTHWLKLLRKLPGEDWKADVPQKQCTVLWGCGIAVKSL